MRVLATWQGSALASGEEVDGRLRVVLGGGRSAPRPWLNEVLGDLPGESRDHVRLQDPAQPCWHQRERNGEVLGRRVEALRHVQADPGPAVGGFDAHQSKRRATTEEVASNGVSGLVVRDRARSSAGVPVRGGHGSSLAHCGTMQRLPFPL